MSYSYDVPTVPASIPIEKDVRSGASSETFEFTQNGQKTMATETLTN